MLSVTTECLLEKTLFFYSFMMDMKAQSFQVLSIFVTIHCTSLSLLIGGCNGARNKVFGDFGQIQLGMLAPSTQDHVFVVSIGF